jgi:hypothetical protein
MGARTIAARVIAAQKALVTAKHIGVNAAIKDAANSGDAWGLASLRGTYKELPALLVFAEGEYYSKLDSLKNKVAA